MKKEVFEKSERKKTTGGEGEKKKEESSRGLETKGSPGWGR